MNVVIIGRNQRRIERQVREIRTKFGDDIELFAVSSHVALREALESAAINMVILSGGHTSSEKAHFVDYIIQESSSTMIHIKDSDSGHKGMVPFICALLTCAKEGGLLQESVATSS